MEKINLAPDVRLDKLRTKRRNFMVTMIAVVTLVATVIFILILQGYRLSRVYSLDQTKKKIANTKEELKDYKNIEDMVINIEQGLKAINQIETSEPLWSVFLPVLEQVTPNDVRFSELSADGNKFTAKAEGQSVVSIARLIKSLENYEYKATQESKEGKKLFKNVNVEEYEIKSGLYTFQIEFEMEQGILW